MNLYEETKMILNQYGLKPNKRLGQNFLINENIIENIIEKSNISEEDIIIEIGPGLGSLTKGLLKKVKKVIAIELDPKMVDILKNRFQSDNLKIIYGDVLKIELKDLISHYNNVKIVANLPYYITTPIVMKLLEERLNIESITIMVQKEVGNRFCACPGSKDYGAITVGINYYTHSDIVIDVDKSNFLPVPEVDSCVVHMKVLKEPPVQVNNEKIFFNLIKSAFSQRRKTIANSLLVNFKGKEEMLEVLLKLNIDPKLRAENLSIFDFANISNNI